jgi:predicted RNA-binding Zn-ribbon protein involved in translation (DUF1610 family)
MIGKPRRTSLRLIREGSRAPLALPAGERALSRGGDLTCPNCGRTFVRRSHRKGLWEYLCSFLLIYPYRCQLCAHRFLATPKLPSRTAHREFERLHVRFPASFRSAYMDRTRTGEGTVTTLSIRGCSLTAQHPLRKGNFLRLHIRYAEEEAPIEIDVAVVRSSTSRQLGVEFLSMQPDEEARLRRLLEHLLYGRFH